MIIKSKGIKNGIIDDKYGKRGLCNSFGMPVISIPLEIIDYPEGTVSFAIFMEDKDAYPVSKGFSWVHWLAANITDNVIEEDASRKNKNIIQGANSWMSIQGGSNSREDCSFYGGMAPPNEPHIYETYVYALDTMLNLKNGFYLNELFKAMEGHILASACIKGEYSN
ncbi:MAG: YbhB/YbcL family Raf kinase inhibitor-like protein [Christensenellaceae bacterium]|nr:YbhB/YbcL family Raf kinase inhibitor-like protein [Christensenellaceae bacterium]